MLRLRAQFGTDSPALNSAALPAETQAEVEGYVCDRVAAFLQAVLYLVGTHDQHASEAQTRVRSQPSAWRACAIKLVGGAR